MHFMPESSLAEFYGRHPPGMHERMAPVVHMRCAAPDVLDAISHRVRIPRLTSDNGIEVRARAKTYTPNNFQRRMYHTLYSDFRTEL